MIQKKICMLGTFAVGKTSLVARFVTGIFSDKYHTTIGVKIDKKVIKLETEEVHLILWDLHGEDEFQTLRLSYLRGASGYLLVVDGTRRATLDHAFSLQQRVASTLGEVPFILLCNKADLSSVWEIEPHELEVCTQQGWTVMNTSAKTGQGVEEAFVALTRHMLR